MNHLPDPSVRVASVCIRILLLTLLVGSALPASAQKARPGKSVDLDQLRGKLVAAIGKDFEVGKVEMASRSNARGGGSYWLVHIKPRRPGSFKLTYRYNYNDPHYSHVEREFGLNVGRQGCRRGVPSYGSYHRFCVGDTIIFPVAIFNFTEHEFSLTSSEYTPEQDAVWEKVYPEPTDERVDNATVKNPLVDHLRFVGTSSHRLLHRNGGYTLEGYATFEAQHPGRFNLSVSAVYPDLPSAVLSGTGTAGGVPIIIVPREAPVTLLASHHEVRGYTMGYNGQEYVSSTSGDAYMVDLMILQPGDRISIKYFTTIRSREFERGERTANDHSGGSRLLKEAPDKIPPPVVSKHPFALDDEYNFTEWLADHLPR